MYRSTAEVVFAWNEGKDIEEIARLLEVDSSWVRSVLSRAEWYGWLRRPYLITGLTQEQLLERNCKLQATVLHMHKDGHDAAHIANMLGISVATVWAALRALVKKGLIDPTWRKNPWSNVLSARQREVLALYQSGYKAIEIARRLGVTPERVRQILKALKRKGFIEE